MVLFIVVCPPYVKVTEMMIDLTMKSFASSYCGGMAEAVAQEWPCIWPQNFVVH